MQKLKGIATGKVISVTETEADEILSHRALGFEVCNDNAPSETVTESAAKVPTEVEHLAQKITKNAKIQPQGEEVNQKDATKTE